MGCHAFTTTQCQNHNGSSNTQIQSFAHSKRGSGHIVTVTFSSVLVHLGLYLAPSRTKEDTLCFTLKAFFLNPCVLSEYGGFLCSIMHHCRETEQWHRTVLSYGWSDSCQTGSGPFQLTLISILISVSVKVKVSSDTFYESAQVSHSYFAIEIFIILEYTLVLTNCK